ncbi:MAG: hypothetical protein C4548_05920 [Desulfobacteraceae bacterium]|nr:MAG: hypothetical protein C4548_05920 [Desulfobacteraceae bacterium]
MARTRRRLLRQLAILDAAMKIALFPEIHDLAHNPTFHAAAIIIMRIMPTILTVKELPLLLRE